ncbi:MAG: NAD-dependent epimerase/dehydratase family protein, partial [Chloroflexi bacterium]|nr:NAD-dependent epimerase/dehydratase family protein [Chloroflexota bacterium]
GAYQCPDHGVVAPKLRPLTQLQQHRWAMECPQPGCGKVVTATPTTEEKPLQPLSIYAIGKRDHEEMFLSVGRAYSIPTVALRYWQVYGQRQALSNPYTGVGAIFCSRILAGNAPPVYEDGGQLRDFVHAKDIAAHQRDGCRPRRHDPERTERVPSWRYPRLLPGHLSSA